MQTSILSHLSSHDKTNICIDVNEDNDEFGSDADDLLANLPSDVFTFPLPVNPIPPTTSRLFPPPDKPDCLCSHTLVQSALSTWIFPTNVGAPRDYQYNIVSKALYHNVLVALPTGLGKTFIAATVMLNWFRWTKHAQIVFVAPTKPLVSQQAEACFTTVGIPRSQTTMLTGDISPGLRAEQWESKRVFFMTPQTIVNDLKTGICDPKRIVLLVIDEAHRATGAYAYVEIVKFIQKFNQHFRVLALTATPGSSVESVQEVINNLNISSVEIRTEFSIDIRQYIHRKDIDTILLENTEELGLIMDLFSQAVGPVLNRLGRFNAYWSTDPLQMTAFGLTQARRKWMVSAASKNASAPIKGMINRIFSVLASLAHGLELLKHHGLGPFHRFMLSFRNDNGSSKGGKYEKEILDSICFQKMMSTLQLWMQDPDFCGHPKLHYLQSVVVSHFLKAKGGSNGDIDTSDRSLRDSCHDDTDASREKVLATRIMIFAQFRDSAEDIVRILERHRPLVRPHVFVGQAASKSSEGMDQKKQLEIIRQFKAGKYNTIVATSIGEEGLDIGEIDLIVCYDSSTSPIRMLQRMGRTGRKRHGQIILLLMKGKEERSFEQAKDNYKKMQEMIASGTRFNFRLAPRVLPRDVRPVVDMKFVDIPVENSQTGGLPDPKTKSQISKRPPKRFHMPENVCTGFLSASSLHPLHSAHTSKRIGIKVLSQQRNPSLQEVLLSPTEANVLRSRYQQIANSTDLLVSAPPLGKYLDRQRQPSRTKYAGHGFASQCVVNVMNSIHTLGEERLHGWQLTLNQNILPTSQGALQQGAACHHGRSKSSGIRTDIIESDGNVPDSYMITTPSRDAESSSPRRQSNLKLSLNAQRQRNGHIIDDSSD